MHQLIPFLIKLPQSDREPETYINMSFVQSIEIFRETKEVRITYVGGEQEIIRHQGEEFVRQFDEWLGTRFGN